MKRALSVFVTALVMGSVPQTGWAELIHARSRMSVAPEKLYIEMLKAAEKQKWKKVKKALLIIDPLLIEIDLTVGVNSRKEIEQAIDSKDKEKVLSAIKRLINLGIKSVLTLSYKETPPDKLRNNIRHAFAEFLILEPYIRSVDFNASQVIKAEFRRVYVYANLTYEDYVKSRDRVLNHLNPFLSPL